MASKTYAVIGKHRCHVCGEEIPTRQSENGTLNLSCWLCGVTAHAKPGTDAHRSTLARVVKKAVPEAPEAAQVKAAEKPQRNTIFG